MLPFALVNLPLHPPPVPAAIFWLSAAFCVVAMAFALWSRRRP